MTTYSALADPGCADLDWAGRSWHVQTTGAPHAIRLTSDASRIKFECRPGDTREGDTPPKVRDELAGLADRLTYGVPYAARWRIQFAPTVNAVPAVHGQIHKGSGSDGEHPMLAIRTDKNRRLLITTCDDAGKSVIRYACPLPAPDTWCAIGVGFVLDPVAGWLAASMNGTRVIDLAGIPIGFAGDVGPYFKAGIYGPMGIAETVITRWADMEFPHTY